jgi:hypothetical protein
VSNRKRLAPSLLSPEALRQCGRSERRLSASANTDEVCPGCKQPRMMCVRSIPRAAVLDTTDDGALPRRMMRATRRAVPTWRSRPHRALWIESGQFAPQDFPRRAPLVPHLGAHNSHRGRGVSANSKDFVCYAHERASVIARLPAADRARIFSANRSMTITAEGRAATGMVLACCATDRHYPRVGEEDGWASLGTTMKALEMQDTPWNWLRKKVSICKCLHAG